MKTREIIDYIESQGGFDNFRKWSYKEVSVWVRSNFDCSMYVAKKVAEYIAY